MINLISSPLSWTKVSTFFPIRDPCQSFLHHFFLHTKPVNPSTIPNTQPSLSHLHQCFGHINAIYLLYQLLTIDLFLARHPNTPIHVCLVGFALKIFQALINVGIFKTQFIIEFDTLNFTLHYQVLKHYFQQWQLNIPSLLVCVN